MSANNGSDKDAKGFGGLSSLLSDVDDLPDYQPTPKSENKKESSRQQSKEGKKTQNNQPDLNNHQSEQTQPLDLRWIWISLALFIGVISIFTLLVSQDHSSEKPKYSYTPPTSAKVDFSISQPSPKQATPARPVEEKPPYGKSKVLSVAQIRYCLAEKVRIDASETVISNYSQSDVDHFNSMVNDYNSRCGEFRYRRGSLKRAQHDIEPYRRQLQGEGKALFAKTKPKPDETVKAIQNQLNKSGYNAGFADGYMDKKTRQAIMANQKNSRITVDGLATNSLHNHSHRPARQLSNSGVSKPSRTKRKPDETVRAIQKRLNELGYNAGSVDGYMGKKTRLAIMDYQRRNQMIVDGKASKNLSTHMKHFVKEKVRRSQSNISSDPENLRTCLSGDYPSLCKHQLLTREQAARVANAERRSGN